MELAAFLLVSLVVIVTPGQDTALTIRNTMLGARRAGVATAAGVASGQFVWTLATSVGLDPSRAFRQGLLSNLGNPKMAVFFTSLLPQFGGESFAALLALGVVFCSLTLAWLSAYADAVTRARRALARPRVRRALDLLTGVVLLALGFKLAAARR